MNLTLIGNCVFVSMDIPDIFLAFSKLLNYVQWNRAKVVAFLVFICMWTYFRHWLNLVILHSVWYEYDMAPEPSRQWNRAEGIWLTWWLRHQIFLAIGALQVLNLFWYWLMMRILARTIISKETTDERSDDEDDNESEDESKIKEE